MADSYGGAEWAKSQDRDADDVRVRRACTSLAHVIYYLSDCDGAMTCPIADWLVTARELLMAMRQSDGGDADA